MQCFDFAMDKNISNNIGPWDQSTVKSLCVDWKFYEFCENLKKNYFFNVLIF